MKCFLLLKFTCLWRRWEDNISELNSTPSQYSTNLICSKFIGECAFGYVKQWREGTTQEAITVHERQDMACMMNSTDFIVLQLLIKVPYAEWSKILLTAYADKSDRRDQQKYIRDLQYNSLSTSAQRFSKCDMSQQEVLFLVPFKFIHQWFYSPLLRPGLFSLVIILTQMVGLLGRVISPSQGDTDTEDNTQTSMPRVGLKPTIPAFEWTKRVHALDSPPTVSALISGNP
jgi:hypothetical protein